jgi:pyruvate formate lyase activating enzyme
MDVGGKIRIDRSLCNNCGDCARACPTGSLKVVGEWMSVEELLAEILKDLPFYQTSGGGVTMSGGEPASQPEFVARLLKECQGNGLHTAIETSGFQRWERLSEVYKHADLVLYDLKLMNDEKHREFTGVSNRLVLKNARRLASEGIPMVIRIPIVPEYTDSEDNLEAIARYVVKLDRIEEIHLLPYHRLGEAKYLELGREYELAEIDDLTETGVNPLAQLVESYGFRVRIGG